MATIFIGFVVLCGIALAIFVLKKAIGKRAEALGLSSNEVTRQITLFFVLFFLLFIPMMIFVIYFLLPVMDRFLRGG